MEIRSDCPTNCKYISGGKCLASECYKGTGTIPMDDMADVAEFVRRGEEWRKYGTHDITMRGNQKPLWCIHTDDVVSLEWHDEQILHAEQEIERLLNENDRLTQVAQEAQREAYKAYQRQFIEQVKQAKIEMLESLKTGRCGAIKCADGEWIKCVRLEDIDEMIANLKEETKHCIDVWRDWLNSEEVEK